ncbi:MAG TPA: exodeoxyribonuclease VII large subunit, partial [Puia sp.]
PVITGIGHQKNETIADLMAHTQTKTPTKAAEFIINHNRNFEDNIARLRQQIIIRTQQTIAGRLKTLNQINNLIVNQSHALLSHRKESLMTTRASIRILCINYTKIQSGYLSHFASVIRIASPEETLKRGFAIIKTGDRITSNPDDIHPGEEIEIILASTAFNANVTSKKDYHGTDFNL